MTADERADLIDLLRHEALPLLLRELDSLTETIENDVVKLVLDGSNEKDLVYRKCRAEGARRLNNAIKTRLQSLKAKSA